MHVGLLDDGGQRLLGQPPRLEEAGKVTALAQPGDAQLDRPGPRLPVAVAIAVALGEPPGALLAIRRAGQRPDLHLHQPLGGEPDHLAQNVGIRRLLYKRAKAHHLIGHRWFLGCVGVSQPDPTGKSPMTTASRSLATALWKARFASALLPRATPPLGTRPFWARFGELTLRSDDLDEILTEASRLVAEALRTDLAKVMELRDDGETLFVRAGVGWKPGVVGEAIVKVSDATSEAHALKTSEPMISPDIERETRFSYAPFLIDNGVRAVANVSIIGAEGKPPFGILQIDSREPRQFTDGDIGFLRNYANLLAAAVNRLRINSDLREREARLRKSEERFRRVPRSRPWGLFSSTPEAASSTATAPSCACPASPART